MGCVGPVVRLRRAADVGLDAGEPVRLDDRADVIEHERGNRCRAGDAHQHADDAAARRADDHGAGDAERRHPVKDVVHLGQWIVAFRALVPFRLATSAIVERDHTPRAVAVRGQVNGKLVEIAAVAAEAGQANDGKPGRYRAAIVSCEQSQAVGTHECRVACAPPQAARRFCLPDLWMPVCGSCGDINRPHRWRQPEALPRLRSDSMTSAGSPRLAR